MPAEASHAASGDSRPATGRRADAEQHDLVGAEAGGIGERGGLGDAAAAGQRVEVAGRCAASHVRPALVDQVVDAERRRASRPADRSREHGEAARPRSSCSSTTSAVMSCSPGRVERIGARSMRPGRCAATAAPRSSATRGRVVDDEHETVPQHALALPEPPSMPRGIGTRVPGATAARGRVGVIGVDRDEHFRETVRPRRRPALRASAFPSYCAIPNGRLSSSSLASTTAPLAESAGSSSSARDDRARDRRGLGLVVVGTAHERAERFVGAARAASRSRCSARKRGGSFDEHVPQRGAGTRARRAAPRGRGDRCPRRPRPRGTGSGSSRRVPQPVEGARDARTEQRPDLGARDEVAPGPARAAARREEPALAVERRLP